MTRLLVGLLALIVSALIARSVGHRIPWRATRRAREAAWVWPGAALAAATLGLSIAIWIAGTGWSLPILGGVTGVLFVVLVAPIAEELVFRELLWLWAAREKWRESFVVLVSGLTFAAYHRLSLLFQADAHAEAILVQSYVALPFGIALMWLRLRYGGLAGCVLVHLAFNLGLLIGLDPGSG